MLVISCWWEKNLHLTPIVVLLQLDKQFSVACQARAPGYATQTVRQAAMRSSRNLLSHDNDDNEGETYLIDSNFTRAFYKHSLQTREAERP